MANYRRFGTTFLGCVSLEDATDQFNRNVGKYLHIYAT